MKLTLRRKSEDAAVSLPALMIKAERAASSVFHGEHAQRRAGAGEKFWQFREYDASDRPQDIDWRQSGKTDRLFIRQKERQLPQSALLWACAAPGMDFSTHHNPTKAECAKIIILALSILITRAGERVGALGAAQMGRSEAALDRIAETLSAGLDKNALPDAGPSRSQKNALVILAGDFISPIEDIESSFKNLAPLAGGGCVIQILDPAEINLPWHGRAIFEEPGTGRKEPAQNIESIQDAYARKIESHIKSIEALARDCGWHYVLHRTDQSIDKTLADIWLSLSALTPKGSA